MKINKTNIVCFVITVATLIVLQLTGVFGWIKNIRKERLVFAYEHPMYIIGVAIIVVVILTIIAIAINVYKQKK